MSRAKQQNLKYMGLVHTRRDDNIIVVLSRNIIYCTCADEINCFAETSPFDELAIVGQVRPTVSEGQTD